MGYQAALNKAWEDLSRIKRQDIYSVKLLSDEYTINLNSLTVISLSCNVPAQDYISILILHYLKNKIQGLPELTQNWVSFQELDGGKGYYPTFKKRVLDPVIKKYGKSPEALLTLIERFSAKTVPWGDYGIVLEALPQVPILLTLWKPDEEFSAEANVLFDASIKEVFPTEDIVVLAEFVARNI